MEWLALFAVGVLVGGINAVAGGGMIFGFPMLIAAGLPAIVANATSKVVVLPGQFSAAFGYRSFAKVLPKSALFLLAPAAFGAALGTFLLMQTSAVMFRHFVPYLILAAVVLFLLEEFWQRHEQRAKALHKPVSLWTIGWLLFVGSIYAGYFGIGFGFVVLALLSLGEFGSVHEMNFMKNLISAVVTSVPIILLLPTALIDWRGGAAMAAGGMFGGYFAARLALKLPTPIVRITIGVFGIITAASFFLTGT